MFKAYKKIWVAGIELLIIVVTVLVATYAWFTDNKQVKNGDLHLKADSHFDLLMSLDEGQTWLTETSLNLPSNFEFKHEITGNGINMYIPSNKLDDGTPTSFTYANATTDYLEFNIMFKLSANVSIFLDSASFVSPVVGTNAEDLIGPDVERISIGGEFSRDLIASSVRVAFIDNEFIDGKFIMNNKASLVWAPNKEYEITCPSTCNAVINSTNEQDYTYIESSTLPVKEIPINNIKDIISASGEEQNAHGDPKLTTIDINEDNGIRKVTIRIWIEGSDRDNVTELTGGLFQMNLQFSAIEKGIDNIAPVVLVGENNTIDGYTNTMEYSDNNGNTWIKYQDNNSPTFDNGQIVKVRKSETKDYFASAETILNF